MPPRPVVFSVLTSIVSFPSPCLADGVVTTTARLPIENLSTHSPSRPLPTFRRPDATSARELTRQSIAGAFRAPRRYSAATEWVTRAAVLALEATGHVTGTGRDDTGEIGKVPQRAPSPSDPPFAGLSGRIR